jgi:hypothetical protein
LSIKKEVDYYPDVAENFIKELSHSLKDFGSFIVDFQPCGTIDLSKGIELIAKRQKLPIDFCGIPLELASGLFVDIIGIIYSEETKKCVLIICELKKKPLSLTDFAQMVGYCYTSSIQCGVLISIDCRISSTFEKILKNNPHLLNFKANNKKFNMGICWWNSYSSELYFDPIGNIPSIYSLSRFIGNHLL